MGCCPIKNISEPPKVIEISNQIKINRNITQRLKSKTQNISNNQGVVSNQNEENYDNKDYSINVEQWQQFKQKAEQEMNGILLLEHLATGAQGSVQVGYISANKQMVAIKHVKRREDYEFEKSAYQFLVSKNLLHLFMNLINNFDEQQYLVIERGSCDLDTFTKLRAQHNDPLDTNELFLIMHTVAGSMRDLHRIGMSFCDMKGANLLMKYNIAKMGYTPVLTDLGGVYCPEIDRDRRYGQYYTPKYFDEKLKEKLENWYQPKENDIVHNELFTLCRTILEQIALSSSKQDLTQLDTMIDLFEDQSQLNELIQLLQENRNQNIAEIMKYLGDVLQSVLLRQQFNDFDLFLEYVNLVWTDYLKQVNFSKINEIRDRNGAVKEWMRQKVQCEQNFEFDEIQELVVMAKKCKDERLYDQMIVTSNKLIKKYQDEEQKMRKIGLNQPDQELELKIANCYLDIGFSYSEIGKKNEALENYTKCLERKISYYRNENHIGLVDIFNNIGGIYYQEGNLQKALQLYQKTVQITIAHYGDQNHYTLSNFYNNIGGIYHSYGLIDEALQFYSRSVQIMIAHFGDKQPIDLADTYQNIGVIYRQKGEFNKSMQHFTLALQYMTQYYGDENHYELADTHHSMGILYGEAGLVEQAMQHFKKAVQIKIAHYGDENHFTLAISYENMGNVYDMQGEKDIALQHYLKAMQIKISYYGDENHFDLATTYGNIGIAYERRKEYEKAIDMYEKSLLIGINHYGQGNIHLAINYYNIASLYATLQNYVKAVENMEEAYTIFTTNHGIQYAYTQFAFIKLNEYKSKLNK